ncbi:MAG TPA: hypothetical protein PLJ35_15475 [Anaerolineae bacterium]|nr:hypothetical protein [Anaerolineae bacterium]HOR00211.1 hypothetical protein [Anaerolineae bacterium]HPL30279.1 hypothetical protein [Anaerolineae bacterium]
MPAQPLAPTHGQELPSAEDPDVPPWQQAYVTCPACHRPVRRERLETHMHLLHPDGVPEQAEPEPQAPPAAEPPARGLRGLLGRLFSRK